MNTTANKPRANLFSYPRWIVLQLLEKCNLRCKMCYEWGEEGAYHEKQSTQQLDFEVVKKVIEDCAPSKPMYDFFGGEPLLYTKVDEVISLIKHYGSELVIPTNGTLVEKNAEMLVETGPDKVWISLDGPEQINDAQRGKGVFRKSIDGINKILELRKRTGKKFPKIGITCIVTPNNHLHIEDFFFKSIDLAALDHVSIEMQLFATREQCREYGAVLSKEFDIPNAPHAYARGMVWEKEKFESMNFSEMVRQINTVANFCKSHNIYFFNYPKTITEQNLSDYFSGNFTKLVDYKCNCRLPWMYAEITAKGDVASCHTYYDLTFGNINNQSMYDIWNCEKFGKFRNYMKNHLLPICTACSRYYDYTI